jgi:hypothetical protein
VLTAAVDWSAIAAWVALALSVLNFAFAEFRRRRSATTADMSVRYETWLEPHAAGSPGPSTLSGFLRPGPAERERFVIHNRGPGGATNVDLHLLNPPDSGRDPMASSGMPLDYLGAAESHHIGLSFTLEGPAPPYEVELTWVDGRGSHSRRSSLNPQRIAGP